MLLLHHAVWGKAHTWQHKDRCLRAEATALLFARTHSHTRPDEALAIIWVSPRHVRAGSSAEHVCGCLMGHTGVQQHFHLTNEELLWSHSLLWGHACGTAAPGIGKVDH